MDTNTMYIEHYVDLHNYISDNIYELDDDVIFTESIWKKVLIGGLAIGGIILLMKNWSKIMGFINKIMGKNIERTVRQAKKLIYKWVDSYSPKQLKNFINHLKLDEIQKKTIKPIEYLYKALSLPVENRKDKKVFYSLTILNNYITKDRSYELQSIGLGKDYDFKSPIDFNNSTNLHYYFSAITILDLIKFNPFDKLTIGKGNDRASLLNKTFIGNLYNLAESAIYKLSFIKYANINDIKESIYIMIESLIYYYNSTINLFDNFNSEYNKIISKINSISLNENNIYTEESLFLFNPKNLYKLLKGLMNNYNPLYTIKNTINNNNWNKKEDLFTSIKTSVQQQIVSFDKISEIIKDKENNFLFINLFRFITLFKYILNNLSDLEKIMSEWINNAPKPEKSEKSDDEDNKE
jgi:hypothetical protein